ncbi:hypothetical protein EBH_0014690 [Eimeria brunetti]|uniref:Uncharacterized protein n=1 Tax=Eimeria brunetti TaxID=51314 RepID=U6LSJ4_9EIME|nr:hypothetical protein EBH_0014690 [Eimeria brunetti]
MNAGSFATIRKGSSSNCSGNFVSDALLRQLEFEDFSRASCWEQLQHEFISCLRGLPIVASRSRYLKQVETAHEEAAAAAASAGAASGRAAPCMHSSASCSSSWHEYPVPPQLYSCMCCSPQQQQQQQRCVLSLHLFAPLVLQQLLPIPRSPDPSVNSDEGYRDQLLRLTYTCSPPLPELSCYCSNSSSGAIKNAPGAEQQPPDQHISGLSVSPVFFNSSSTSGYNTNNSSRGRNNKELRCGTCAACVLRWEEFFPSRAPSIQRSFGVSEFLQLESVRLPEVADTAVGAAAAAGSANQDAEAAARATGAAAVPLHVPKETARAALAALGLAARGAEPCQHGPVGEQQQQQQLLSKLPLFCVYDPLHEDCVGSQVLQCPAAAKLACVAATPLTAAAAHAAAAAETEGKARADVRERSALLIRQYESRCLSSAFAACDLPKFLHLLLPFLGAKLQQQRNQGGQQHALSLLLQLTVAAQYTYFLPGPWQQMHSSAKLGPLRDGLLRKSRGDGTCDAAQGAKAWRQQQTCSTFNTGTQPSSSNGSSTGSSSSSDCNRPSDTTIRGWRELALGASIPSFDQDDTPVSSADRLLQQLLLQRCPFEALHVIWCSPLQPLGEFWSSSRSSGRPLAAAFDCRLRLNLYAPLLRAHGRLLQHYSLSLRTLEQQVLNATDFLQEDIWRQQCRVTSRVHQLSRLLLLAGRSSSIKQQPFASVTSKTFRSLESTRRRGQAPHNLRLLWRSAAASKHGRRGSTSPEGSSLRSSSKSSSSDEASEYNTTRDAEGACIEAEVQQLFRPMTRQQQLLIHQQQVKRLLLAGNKCCSECSCCCSACGCCGIDLAFGLLWGSTSSNSFFAELALCAGKQQSLSQLQRLWQKLLMRLRWMWDQGLLLPRIVSGLTAATAASCAVQAAAEARPAKAAADATNGQGWSALAAGLGVACCPDGPSALPDVCCCSLQQLLQQLNCAIQQQRLQLLLQDMPKEQHQQPFESLRFVLPGISHLYEPILPILPPITEAILTPKP